MFTTDDTIVAIATPPGRGGIGVVRVSGTNAKTIGSRLLAGYLGQPYAWFLNKHSAQLGANNLADVNKVVGQAMMPAMRLLSQGVITLALIGLLVVAVGLGSVAAVSVLRVMFGQ